MALEEKIFYFKEGVVTDNVEHERGLALEIINELQAENKRLREALEVQKENLTALQYAENFNEALKQGRKMKSEVIQALKGKEKY